MSAQHTPGPWRIEGSRGAGLIISAGVNPEGDGPNSYVGVLDPMFYVAGSESPFRADADLICAAPDLLRVLSNSCCFGCGTRFADNCDDALKMSRGCVSCTAQRAAISKATGGAA